ncbi:pre-mRNA-splicing factor SLU7 [Kwoniella dejecticola CBS 10117]|uniref:Pre-mRNA-splicing factor SLU7 n=1 Tax=Kwoniella dejecticola CBS 10117 TaxID=1296121 RepID=A0A1A6A3B6_9TREE|nr:pre-mRNA-splicing factor SLU7 [Kwoniella dejecticola CBS 10117]OBR84552.1 pre-mRNA-splicing factor SLU7 [Kwoniella dejecticola CBS 10117]
MLNTSAALQGGKISREEFRRQKDLDAARKAGTAPAAVDEEGNAINPHIPEYITKAPWYADTGKPSLAHQRIGKIDGPALKMDEWYERGQTAGPAAKKYRKGACENCGAMTHKKKDCLERPRKKGAKFTNKNIAPDEVIQSFASDYDSKRDRWNGYDPSSYKNVVDEYEATEAARKKFREEEIDNQTSNADLSTAKKLAKKEKLENDDDFGSSDEDEDDEDKYAEAADQIGQKLDTKTRITVRNLRIREDTAKYLHNLDADSAYYDPKTRSMRDAPVQGMAPEDMKFAGDNFQRFSGDATNIQKLQMFAWQSAQRGNNVHVLANPTAGELLHKEFQEKKEVLKDTNKSSILARYGGEEHLERLPRELLNGQTEDYVEYSRSGQVVKGREKAVARSKYDEDVYINNHTAIWGSYYDISNGQWGFACCHSLLSGSYCTGEAGKTANSSSSVSALLESAAKVKAIEEAGERERKSLADEHLENLTKANANGKGKERERDREGPTYGSRPDDMLNQDKEVDLNKDKLRKALADEKKRKGLNEDAAWEQNKKSKTDVSQEELEAYRLSRQGYDDPMANYKDTDAF